MVGAAAAGRGRNTADSVNTAAATHRNIAPADRPAGGENTQTIQYSACRNSIHFPLLNRSTQLSNSEAPDLSLVKFCYALPGESVRGLQDLAGTTDPLAGWWAGESGRTAGLLDYSLTGFHFMSYQTEIKIYCRLSLIFLSVCF